MGELLESSGAYPFMDRGTLRGDDGVDLNTIIEPGVYRIYGISINIPDTGDSFPMNYGVLKVYKARNSLVQEVINDNYTSFNHYYIRTSSNNGTTWYNWRKIL